MGHMMRWGYGMMGMGGWIGILLGLILIGIIIYFVVRLAGNNNRYTGRRDINNALEVLNERYAKGEITEEEYRQKKDLILKS